MSTGVSSDDERACEEPKKRTKENKCERGPLNKCSRAHLVYELVDEMNRRVREVDRGEAAVNIPDELQYSLRKNPLLDASLRARHSIRTLKTETRIETTTKE